jgi:hypothetical protein
MVKRKKTNNDLQKDRVTRTPLKIGVDSSAKEGKQFLLH